MRERPTVVLLHPGPGFDHGLFKVTSARGWRRRHRSSTSICGAADAAIPARLRSTRSSVGPTTCTSSARVLGSSGRSCSASGSARSSRSLRGAAIRHEPAALVLGAPVARIVPERSVADVRAARRAEDAPRWRGASTRRWTIRLRGLRPRLLPAPLELRADERRDRPRPLEPGGADGLDGRVRRRRSTCAPSCRRSAPALVLAGRTTRGRHSSRCARSTSSSARRALPELRPRAPLVFRDAPEAYEELRLFLDEVKPLERLS